MASASSQKRSRAADAGASSLGVEFLELQPLGAGCEVGRSCHVLRFKGKTLMLDCGILPSFTGVEALPLYFSEGSALHPSEVDVIFITHFHLDHCAALPHFTERMQGFRGRIFATHPTVAVMRMVLRDFVKVSAIAADSPNALYSGADIDACLARIECVDLRQRVNVGGVNFQLLNAGHVLGAAMVMLEMAGVRVLYTGDYSCEEDRHLAAAECPRDLPPNVLIVEATYGMTVHEGREQRERRFCEAVEKVVRRGGRCLIPVFALGRAQELMLILEEYWRANASLQAIPIFHANKMAEKSLEVYRTYIGHMNARMQQQVGDHNPWNFQFVRETHPKTFRDSGPCVMLASPGMLQSGFSRKLFDAWCEDARNGVVLAGYSVEGTLARALEQNPVEVESLQKRRLTRRIGIERVSFAAHADSLQTGNFIEQLRPDAIVLVHGERNEMRRLCDALARKYRAAAGFRGCYMPRNNEAVRFRFQEERVVRLVGGLADRPLRPGVRVQGILVHHHFETLLLQPAELARFTQLATHSLRQRLHVPYRSSFAMLKAFVRAMYTDSEEKPEEAGAAAPAPTPAASASSSAPAPPAAARKRVLSVAGGLVTATHQPPDRVVLTWAASPVGDMIADSLVAVIAQAEVSQASVMRTSKPCGHSHGAHGAHGAHSHADEEDDGIAAPTPADRVAAVAAAVAAAKSAAAAKAAAASGDVEDDVAEARAAAEWVAGEPWARDILSSDSGPFAAAESAAAAAAAAAEAGEAGAGAAAAGGRPAARLLDVDVVAAAGGAGAGRAASGPPPVAVAVPASSGAAARGGGGGSGGGDALLALAPPARRRRDMLVRVLRDQYGAASVRVADEGAPRGFCVHVALDDKSARVRFGDGAGGAGGAGFSVEASEGADDRVQLGPALERACELVDELFRPVA